MRTLQEIDNELLQYRKKHFAVKVTPEPHPQENGNVRLSVTYNGYQWTTISLLKSEVKEIIEALQTHQ